MAKKKLIPGFEELYFDSGGMWFRRIDLGKYHFIELIDWKEATGEENSTGAYTVDLKVIDILQVNPEQIAEALNSYSDDTINSLTGEERNLWVAEALVSYGTYAPVGDWTGDNFRKLLDQARAKSKRLREDAEENALAMSKPVNRIGTSAEDFMKGNIFGRAKKVMEKAETVVVQYAKILEQEVDKRDLEIKDLKRQLEECKKRKPIILPSH